MPLHISVTAVTHKGKQREHNEDTVAVHTWVQNSPIDKAFQKTFCIDKPILVMLADGMGGHAKGEIASQFVSKYMTQTLINAHTEESLRQKIQAANHALYDYMEQRPETVGMGTTLAGLLFQTDGLLVFNVGDSRIYKERAGYLRQLTEEHTLDFSDTGNRKSTQLTKSLGGMKQREELTPFVSKLELKAKQRYLLCTDGLTDMLDLDSIEAIFRLSSDEIIVNTLFEKTLETEARDNISIILVTVY